MNKHNELAAQVAQELKPLLVEIVSETVRRSKEADAVMDSSEVMNTLSISRATLQRWLSSGKLKAEAQPGRKLLFKRATIENLLKNRH